MSAEDFLDTNVFIYLFDETDDFKRRRAESVVQSAIDGRSGCISYQIVQETLNVLTGRLNIGQQVAEVLMDTTLAPLWTIYPSPTLFRLGLDVRARYRFSYYDSLIVAAALQAGCTRLYTEDMQHGQVIDGLTIEDPFRS